MDTSQARRKRGGKEGKDSEEGKEEKEGRQQEGRKEGGEHRPRVEAKDSCSGLANPSRPVTVREKSLLREARFARLFATAAGGILAAVPGCDQLPAPADLG